jgi:K+/H+ antiporter YhaU regulatory subunit KhtT
MTGCAHSAGRTLGSEAAHQQKPASITAVIRE